MSFFWTEFLSGNQKDVFHRYRGRWCCTCFSVEKNLFHQYRVGGCNVLFKLGRPWFQEHVRCSFVLKGNACQEHWATLGTSTDKYRIGAAINDEETESTYRGGEECGPWRKREVFEPLQLRNSWKRARFGVRLSPASEFLIWRDSSQLECKDFPSNFMAHFHRWYHVIRIWRSGIVFFQILFWWEKQFWQRNWWETFKLIFCY